MKTKLTMLDHLELFFANFPTNFAVNLAFLPDVVLLLLALCFALVLARGVDIVIIDDLVGVGFLRVLVELEFFRTAILDLVEFLPIRPNRSSGKTEGLSSVSKESISNFLA
jgi:hypothetical protein